jgi:GTPase SAR1 family protein
MPPTVILVIGMAGSGKTSLMQRLMSHLHQSNKKTYAINLDPAVHSVPYAVNIDIRDTVNYKEVMQQYNLGPNGGILTALNLFTTKFGQVLDLVDRRVAKDEVDYILLDTPGQIEIFTWSASGSIITDSLAATYPTIVIYVVDTPKSTLPTTFMSNMLYSCSILYRTRLPFVLAFNKSDIVSCEFAREWMQDFEAFQMAVEKEESSYMHSLVRSMGLALEEFYEHLRMSGCSARTGEGMDNLVKAIQEAVSEYDTLYRPELQARLEKQMEKEKMVQDKQLNSFLKDLQEMKENKNA